VEGKVGGESGQVREEPRGIIISIEENGDQSFKNGSKENLM